MAKTVTPKVILQNIGPSQVGRVVTWDNIALGDTCEPFKVVGYVDKSVDINGTFSGSGTISIQGANHPTVPVYSKLTDAFDTAIDAIAADEVKVVMQHTYWIKPVLASGDGSTDINVDMLLYTSSK